MGTNKKQTSAKLATQAAQTLTNANASKTAKRLAASVLSQTSTDKQTSAEMENMASKVLNSSKYNDETKSLAGSVLSQANKDRKL